MAGICYIAPDVEVPYHKGSSTHVLELARAFAQLGHKVHVISRRGNLAPEMENIDGVSVHRIYRGIISPVRRRNGVAYGTQSEGGSGFLGKAYHLYLESCFALYAAIVASRIIQTYSLDVIIERETAFGAGALASKMCNIPMVLEMIGPRYSNLSMRTCSKVFAYNERMLPRGAMEKVVFVKAAVNPGLFRPDREAGRAVRNQLALNGAFTVGYVGSFLDWHGVDDLLDAAAVIIKQSSGVKFVFVGPYTKEFTESVAKRELSDAVRVVGPVPYDQVPPYINACDILVAPYNITGTSRSTKGIGSPLKVLEYMACGKPTIGSALPQVADLVKDGMTGLLFPQGDSHSLARCIMLLANDPGMRQQLGDQALASVTGRYTWSILATEIASILDEIRAFHD